MKIVCSRVVLDALHLDSGPIDHGQRCGEVLRASTCSSRKHAHYPPNQYMPPPIPPIAAAPCCACSGIIEMTASVVSRSEAMDAAF